MCGFKPASIDELDAHHICDRNLIPFGGYILSNGISLCTDRSKCSLDCHRKAESLNEKGIVIPGYSPKDLYDKIESSYWKAYHDSLKFHLPWHLLPINQQFRQATNEELKVCTILNCEANSTTWELACETLGIDEQPILIYGKGRFYASHGGTERCNQEDNGRVE